MHSVLWPSVLASAGVATAVTLLIEYFAKPWLEAYKERILEEGKERRSALKALNQSALTIVSIGTFNVDLESIDDLLKARLRKFCKEVEGFMQLAFNVLDPPSATIDQWLEVTGAIIAHCISLAMNLCPVMVGISSMPHRKRLMTSMHCSERRGGRYAEDEK